jgi:hypothetical protein
MIDRYYRPFTLQRQADGATIVSEPSYTTVGTYRGFIQPRSGSETSTFNAVDESYRHVLYTAKSTPVQYGDRIVQDGVTWRAVFVTQPTGIAGQSHHKEIGLSYVGG